MDNHIRVYDDVIDAESCQKLIEKFESFEDRLEEVYEKDDEYAISFKQLQIKNGSQFNRVYWRCFKNIL